MHELNYTSPNRDGLDYRLLMDKRIRKVLLICSSYDAWTLEEDGQLESRIIEEYTELSLSNPPSFTRVSTSAEALELLQEQDDFDLVISLYNIGEPDVFTFAKRAKQIFPSLPIVFLASYSKEINSRIEREDTSGLDYVFYWYGNADLIMAIIKLVEDSMNADYDILDGGVQAILLVEDSIRYISTYLPAIYKLVLTQSAEFMKEALNEQQQLLRKRARPKILLATNYTDAVGLYERYKEHLLGVISDIAFVLKKGDPPDSEKIDAGIELCRLIKRDNPFMPFLLQSSQESMRAEAEKLGVGFLLKYSKTLLMELGEYISREFAFGDFIFTDLETGEVIGRAKDLRQMQKLVMEVPGDLLKYHAAQNNLSKWLYSRGLFTLAGEMRSRDAESFGTVDDMRKYIRDAIKDYRIFIGQGVVAKFSVDTYNSSIGFARIGEGSLGGKARGLAFFNALLLKYGFYDKYPGCRVLLPRTVAVTTDYFDKFIVENGLKYVINSDLADEEILAEFVSSRLPQELIDNLREFLKYVKTPLAIRSSSKLEDSYYQPFAGIYSTYMIPHTANRDQMLRMLGKAIKSVYASVFFASSRSYINATSNVLAEEKMGIVIQEVCGTADNGYFFPTISGTARSVNFYPLGNEKAEEGIVNIAFGLGKLVVDGGQTLRFSPKYPRNALQLSTPEIALKDTQKEMYALSLQPDEFRTSADDGVNLRRFEINSPEALSFRNMRYAASSWDAHSHRISDSWQEGARKIITFASVLKYNTFPLPAIISDLLEVAVSEMRSPVEIEFAVNMDVEAGKPVIFNFLQIRPVVESTLDAHIDWKDIDTENAFIYAEKALGTGIIENVRDVIMVKRDNFDARYNNIIASEVARYNAELGREDRNYLLVGPGRWGSSDPWLGIPVKWGDISNARVIVEAGMDNYRIEPSQGTHFFQNLTSMGIGYLTINPYMEDGSMDERKLQNGVTVSETEYIRHIRFEDPMFVYIDGKKGKGVISADDKCIIKKDE